MTLSPEAVDFLCNNEWIEWTQEGFDKGFAYVLKPGAPQDVKQEFNEIKGLFTMFDAESD